MTSDFTVLSSFYYVFSSCLRNVVATDYTVGVVRVSKDQRVVSLHSKAIVPEKCNLLQYLRGWH